MHLFGLCCQRFVQIQFFFSLEKNYHDASESTFTFMMVVLFFVRVKKNVFVDVCTANLEPVHFSCRIETRVFLVRKTGAILESESTAQYNFMFVALFSEIRRYLISSTEGNASLV